MFDIKITREIDAEGDWEFVVELDHPYTVAEFIDAVLSRAQFGSIKVDYIMIDHYESGKTKSHIPANIAQKRVKSVLGYGFSWMRKDYHIKTE